MRRTSAYFISLVILFLTGSLMAQDTIQFPLKMRAGFDLVGPGIYIDNPDNMSFEGYISRDMNEKLAYTIEGGYLRYKYSQYNYDYISSGIFVRVGPDFNLLKPEVSKGKYWAGIGLRYGLSVYKSETPFFKHENYWGTASSSIPSGNRLGHFLEVAPGVRTELFRNLTIGWTLRMRILLSGGGGKDLKPIYFPGFGSGNKMVNAGIGYYITLNIPFKTIRVITRPEPPEEPEEDETGTTVNQQGY